MKEAIDVIVVDDDVDLSLLMESILNYAHYKVTRVNVPAQLAILLETTEPKAIIIDMLLSGKDGREVCRQLKENESSKKIPIMMVSAHPEAETTCIDAGADLFLSKPFDMDVFISKIEWLIGKAKK